MNKHRKTWFPKQILWRLTFTNIIIIASFIALSSWAIYNTACFLADGMGTMDSQKQGQFDATLFQYLWVFSISAIVIGSLIHFYFTKKLIHPIRELIESTKQMKQGQYPNPLVVNSDDETGQLINHFNDLVEQLKNNQQYRQKLVSDLSHELRTPLSNLNGYLNALKSGVISGDKQLYQSLHEELKRLISLVEQFEQLKEWDYLSKQTFSQKEPLDMVMLVEQTVEMFHWSLRSAGIEVKVQTKSGVVNVYDGGIPQVISNLIDNAIRYYQGIEPIIVTGENLSTEYKVSVSGPGQIIPLSEQSRIFERFYRVDPSRARDTGGTGLGLAISKEIVDHHNGQIGIRSNGTYHTFWFTLPLV
ncbi:sensor histidine kinase [Lentibacillus sp. Marseille-P4043]|uniref:sensor histidine kinase n=1 Tax=Lentibacillus sp. Marseille-P4043 TaxID=2040293 RepID=UPI000D0B1D8D|nr:ATP-binding protein [Lentibacillus sp. Marseille-P4043]